MRGGHTHQAPSSRRKPDPERSGERRSQSRATWIGLSVWPRIPASAGMTRFLGVLMLALFCCTTTAAFAAKTSAAKIDTLERVVAVKPDGTLQLSASGVAVLANIFAPNPDTLSQWLAEYTLQKEFPFRALGDDDRYGRALMESTLQVDVLNDGAAVYYASAGKIPEAWREAEVRARIAKRGVWDDRAETVLTTPTQAASHMGKFKVVEGTLTRVYEAKTATYVNFGEDWHSDFSITIPAKNRRSFNAVKDKLVAGARVSVRGVIYEENGPMVALTRPDNLEIR